MAYLLERDALNGKEGRLFMTIDGRNIEVFQLKNLNVDADFQEADFKVVGTRLVQRKTTGVQLTGSMELYYGSPEFVLLVENYIKFGRLPYFTLQVTNDDPSTSVGVQTVALYDVKLQSVPIALLDADADWLSETVSFSFTSFEVLSSFTTPDQLGN